MHTEWDLLMLSEDIKIGDFLMVEDENGNTQTLKLINFRTRPRNVIYLKDENDEEFTFSGNTLEEIGGCRYITGKDWDRE